ncbi:MAG TPA: hypothetical protein VHB20_03355, partial [Verrucomicrobiae bacterium]|nr:hypothetical protein [Verrucomicrobiae bacterium]
SNLPIDRCHPKSTTSAALAINNLPVASNLKKNAGARKKRRFFNSLLNTRQCDCCKKSRK